LYLLYAHLQVAPDLQLGDQVACGGAIGAIGDSGNALNPHLHLELRIGPQASRFHSMAHYDASATPEEMASYCTWRVSGQYQLIDPLKLLRLSAES
jgi:murein DD-endopeptidase MepM/ murein hydrolase activator NlpD